MTGTAPPLLTEHRAREVAEAAHAHLTATADKRGRYADRPYVPVIVTGPTAGDPVGHRAQILARAFPTRADAVSAAQQQIARQIDELTDKLRQPRQRALREWHGLPREVTT